MRPHTPKRLPAFILPALVLLVSLQAACLIVQGPIFDRHAKNTLQRANTQITR